MKKKRNSDSISALITKLDEMNADKKAVIHDYLVFTKVDKDEENFERTYKWMEDLSEFSSKVLYAAFEQMKALGLTAADHRDFKTFKALMLERFECLRPKEILTVGGFVTRLVNLWISSKNPKLVHDAMKQELRLRMAIINGYRKGSWDDGDPEFPDVFNGIEGLEDAVEAMKEKAYWTGPYIRHFLDNVVHTVYELPGMSDWSNVQRFNAAILHELNPEDEE